MKKLYVFLFPFLLLLFVALIGNGDVSSVYYGDSESGYPFVGYITIDRKDGKVGFCGVNYFSEGIGITAAHCLTDAPYDEIHAFTGEFNYSLSNSLDVEYAFTHPDYDEFLSRPTAAFHDIAILQLEDSPELREYVDIASPQVGCDYYLLGYGDNEDDEKYDRRGAAVCITKVTSERFEMGLDGAFFCSGDSGSGIYEKGTNNLVGIVSTYGHEYDCSRADAFFATRVDANKSFLDKYTGHSPSDISNPDDKTTTQTTSYRTSQSSEETSDAVICVFAMFMCCLFLLFMIISLIGLILFIKMFSK